MKKFTKTVALIAITITSVQSAHSMTQQVTMVPEPGLRTASAPAPLPVTKITEVAIVQPSTSAPQVDVAKVKKFIGQTIVEISPIVDEAKSKLNLYITNHDEALKVAKQNILFNVVPDTSNRIIVYEALNILKNNPEKFSLLAQQLLGIIDLAFARLNSLNAMTDEQLKQLALEAQNYFAPEAQASQTKNS